MQKKYSIRICKICLLCSLLVVLLIKSSNAHAGDIYYNSGSISKGSSNGQVNTPRGEVGVFKLDQLEEALLIPDIEGNYIQVPLGDFKRPSPVMKDVHEIRLKVRELTSQLLETWPSGTLKGMIAVPVTFTPLGYPQESTPLGQYLTEAMIYEFNTRGFPVYEYRFSSQIQKTPSGSFIKDSESPVQWVTKDWAAVILGTFYQDEEAIIVNVRMVRASDNMVLRTAQTILPMTPYLARMAKPSVKEYDRTKVFDSGTFSIVSGSR